MLDFSRRINGLTYYSGVLLAFSIGVLIALMFNALPSSGAVSVIGGVVGLVVIVILFVYFICLVKQRANDMSKHPLLVTLVGLWPPVFWILGLIPGQEGENKFGSPPKKRVNLRS